MPGKDLEIQDNHGLLMWDVFHVYFQNKLILLLIIETLRKEKVKAAGAAFTPKYLTLRMDINGHFLC